MYSVHYCLNMKEYIFYVMFNMFNCTYKNTSSEWRPLFTHQGATVKQYESTVCLSQTTVVKQKQKYKKSFWEKNGADENQ